MKKPLIILTGPTAAGKTALSVQLAKTIGGEIISADSMQVYQGMDIGSAKISKQEMDGVAHHLIDILRPDDEFHVVKWKELAKEAVSKIYENGHIPIVVGGTGFYIQALLYDIDFTDSATDITVRERWETYEKEHGALALHEQLKRVDEVSALMIHCHNVKRVVRALEFYELTGRKISEHNETERKKESPYDFYYFVLTDERERLYERINKRVDQMVLQGLEAEVRQLLQAGYHRDLISMQGLGYKEMISYIEGDCSLLEAVYQIKRDTRHFAKRQITWFKRERQVIWLDQSLYQYDNERIQQTICEHMKGV